MLTGYPRVLTTDQDLALQTDALTNTGCEKLFTDKANGTKVNRLGLAEALHFVQAGGKPETNITEGFRRQTITKRPQDVDGRPKLARRMRVADIRYPLPELCRR